MRLQSFARALGAAAIAAAFFMLCACGEATMTSHYIGLGIGEARRTVPSTPLPGISYYLPRGMIPLSIKPASSGSALQITQGTVQMVPDRRARFLIQWHENSFSLDKFTVAIDSNGLLTSLNSDVTDQTPQIVQKVVDIAAQAAISAAADSNPSGASKCQGDLLIDPFLGSSVAVARTLLSRCGLQLAISFPNGEPFPTSVSKVQERELEDTVVQKSMECASSVCFRPVIPILIRIQSTAGDVSSSFIVAIPDVREIAEFDLTRGACIDRIQAVTFSAGVLQKADLTKPSEVLACLEIPMSIVKAIAIPNQILTVRLQNATNEANILQQDRNIILNQQALLQAKLMGR